jgi:putative aldouronate transport system substrate-binding protein
MWNRRTFVRLTIGAAPFIASACALPGQSANVSGTATGGTPIAGASSAAGGYPTYIPLQNGPKADYPSSSPDYEDGFDHYPANPVKALADQPPGAGSTVNVMTVQLTPPPTPLDQNVAWQAVNRALNANVQFQLVSQADYQAKLATVMASNDLPDIVFLLPHMGASSALAAAPGVPQFLQSQAADLTPYLAGDAARDYPYLAATPTIIWKNVGCAYQGHLYLTPVPRTQLGQLWMKNAGVYDREIGQDYVPKNADDFKRVLQELTRPQDQFYGIATAQGTTMLVPLFSQMFGAPNGWRLESDGKLTRAWETPEFKAATGYVRDLWAVGVFHPDSGNYASAVIGRNNFSAGKFAIYPGDTPLAWRDAWRDNIATGQPFDIHYVGLFPAYDGGKPQTFLVGGNLYGSFLKKAPATGSRSSFAS